MSDDLDFLNDPVPPARPSRRFSWGSVVLLAGLLAIGGVLALQLTRQNQIQPVPGEIAPDFTLRTFDGEDITLSELRGKIVIVNFWGSWCAQCYGEAPDLQDIHDAYTDQVVVIGVNWLDTPTGAQSFIDQFGLTYANGEDTRERIAKAYRIQGAPENFIINAEGVIAASLIGAVDYPTLATVIDNLLAGGAG